MKTFKVACPKCRGTGHIAEWKHKADGKCFRCAGSGMIGANESQYKMKWLAEATEEMLQTMPLAKMEKALEFAKTFSQFEPSLVNRTKYLETVYSERTSMQNT